MSRVRRAFAMASAEQYLGLLINFIMLTILARLLTPSEVGVAVIGMSVPLVVFSLRTFVTPEFLIQARAVGGREIRTAFTLHLILTLVLATGLLVASGAIARFYRAPDLALFLQVCTLAALLDAVAHPISAILSRDMAFGILARIRTAGSASTALVTIASAWFGHSYMSYAWGMLVGAVVMAGLAYAARPKEWSFRPGLEAWREALAFGRFKGATIAIERIYEAIPQLLLGRIMPSSALGLYNRASAVCNIPDRMLLSAVFAMAFPALAEQVREGRDIKGAFLHILEYITVFYWPALIVVAMMAESIVQIILGEQWSAAAPLVRILALASLFWFPVVPANPLLLALGENRDAFISSLLARSGAAVILCCASFFGLKALALSQLLAIPLQMYIALHFAQRHAGFTWRELFLALRGSFLVTICAVVGPLAFVLTVDWPDAPFASLAVAGVFSLAGWVMAIVVTGHSIMEEIRALWTIVARGVGSWHGRKSARLLTGAAK